MSVIFFILSNKINGIKLKFTINRAKNNTKITNSYESIRCYYKISNYAIT
jgi:hypothetical protein